MNILYIECKMGSAGDMLMAALYELCSSSQKDFFIKTMNSLFSSNHAIEVLPETRQSCGITGTHMKVTVHGTEEPEHLRTKEHMHEHKHHHAHASYQDILHCIEHLSISNQVKTHAKEVYQLIGDAESKVHNCSLEQIHFHEVGSLDALADVVGCCLLIDLLNVDSIVCSPIHVGNGSVKCAHGILPVPAPATSELLKGIPYYTGDIMSELCTPTGAALLKHFATNFSSMPVMTTSGIGIGLGSKEFAQANCIRCFLGETVQDGEQDEILELSCNIDDMTGEALGYAMDKLLSEGALDVFFSSIQMKKNRPGVIFYCICKLDEKEKFIQLLLKYTSTRGLRYQTMKRAKLSSLFEEIETEYGTIRKKISYGYGVQKEKYEFEDIKKAALDSGKSISEIEKQLNQL